MGSDKLSDLNMKGGDEEFKNHTQTHTGGNIKGEARLKYSKALKLLF